MKKRGFYINILIFVLSFSLSLLAGELALGMFGFKPYIEKLSTSLALSRNYAASSFEEMINKGQIRGIYGNLKPDSDLGYTYYDTPHGFKDTKDFYGNWSGYKRVLVLGDSFTQGASAEPGRGFVDLLNKHYQKRRIIFFNTGTGGYSQNNELAVLKKYCDVLKPDTVILCFYTGNDFHENLTPLDRFTAFPGEWIMNYEVIATGDAIQIRRRNQDEIFMLYKQFTSSKIIPQNFSSPKEYLKYKFFYRSRMGTLLWLAMHRVRSKVRAFRSGYKKDKTPTLYRDSCDYGYSATKGCISEIKKYLAERNIQLYAFIIPDHLESKIELKKSRNYRRAISLFQELSILYLDPFDSLTLGDYYKNGNDHWNNSGHFKAYKLLKGLYQ